MTTQLRNLLAVVVVLLWGAVVWAEPAGTTGGTGGTGGGGAGASAPAGNAAILKVSDTLYTEAQRQHMVRQSVDTVITDFRALVTDLASNGLLKQGGGPDLEKVAGILGQVNTDNVPAAAKYLEEARRQLQAMRPHLQGAQGQIDIILAELSRILDKKAGGQPGEDLVALLRVVIEQQKTAAEQTADWGKLMLQKPADAEPRRTEVGGKQQEVAQSYGRFKEKLDKAAAGEEDPVAKLRLMTTAKIGEDKKVDQTIAEAAKDILAKSVIAAVGKQKEATRVLEEMLKALELNNAFDQLEQMKDARQKLEEILKEQTALREKTEADKPEQFDKEKHELQGQQRELTRKLEQVEVPHLEQPAAKPEDKQPAAAPPEAKQPDAKQKAAEEKAAKSADPVSDAKQAMTGAEQKIEQTKQEPATTDQREAEANLAEAIKRLDQQIAQAEQQMNDPLADTLAKVDELIKDQKALKEKTQQEAEKKAPTSPLNQPQKDLEQRTEEVRKEAPNQGMQQAMDAPLKQAEEKMNEAAKDLADNKPQEAQKAQDEAVKALEQARAAGEQELAKQAEMMAQMQALQQAMNQVNQIAQRQQALKQQTAKAQPQQLPQQAPPQKELGQETKELADQNPKVADPLNEAAHAMEEATGDLEHQHQAEAQTDQQHALDALHHAGEELAHEMGELAKEMGLEPGQLAQMQAKMPGPPMPIPGMHPMPALDPQKGLQQEFFNKPPAGETAKGDTRWNSLGQRDRASLNQRFARELPMEYRELLQDYYSALAK